MMQEDNSSVWSVMYSDAEEPTTPNLGGATSSQRTRKVRVGPIEYEVPTVEYVAQLEALVREQGHLIDRLAAAVEANNKVHRSRQNDLDRLRQQVNAQAGKRP